MKSYPVVREVSVMGEMYEVHAVHQPYFPGQSGGRGERRVSPDEPEHYEIDKVIDLSDNHEVDLSACADYWLDSIHDALMEEE